MHQRINTRRSARRSAGPADSQKPTGTRGSIFPLVLVFLMFAIMVMPAGLNYATNTDMPTEGDPLSRTIWITLIACGAMLVIRNKAQVSRLLAASNVPFLVFIVLASLSLLWSIAPGFTIKRLFRLYAIVLVCIAFATSGWRPRLFESTVRTLLFLVLASSAIFCYVNPELAIHQFGDLKGAWHGITTGKNLLGSLAGCAFVLWLHAYLTRESGRFWSIANMALAGFVLVMSRSSTSLMSTVFAIFFILLLLRSPKSMQRYMPYVVGVFAIAVLLYAMAVLRVIPGLDVILSPISMITGKDQTFTGRTNIWYVLRLHIAQHPLLGTGYGAYWIGPTPSSPSYDMVTKLFFYPTEGHNGYLDVINDLGYVGEICLLAYFLSYIRQALKLAALNRGRGALYLALIFRAFLADMSETHWFSVLSIDFVIFTLATYSLTRELIHAQDAAAAPPSSPEVPERARWSDRFVSRKISPTRKSHRRSG